MGLETPLALLGLLAAVLPWLAHRIRRRDLRPRPLPTFALLLRAEARKRRSRGLTDLLLLLLRVGIVSLACLAIAAPYVSARLTFGDGRIASAAIVIDDSMSMLRREGDETLLSLAIERAREALASLPPGSEVALVSAGRRARVLTRRTTDLTLARLELERLEPRARGADLQSAITLAVQQLESARHPTRRLLVLSDFAVHTGLSAKMVALDGIQVTLERIGSVPPPANLYFTALRALPDPTTKGMTSIAIELAGFGEAPEQVPVSVYSAGRKVAQAQMKLVSGRARHTLHVPTPAADADPTAIVRIEASDAIDADNTAGVLLRPSDAVQVMLVNGDPHPASREDELHYAVRALRFAAEQQGAALSLRSVDASALAKYDLTQVDALVLANAQAPEPAVAERIARFVQEGGGLIVTAGDHVEARAYNAALGGALPCRIGARRAAELALDTRLTSKLLPEGPSGLTQVTTRKRLLLECESGVELRFSDGAPALALADVGRGRSAVLATTLDDDWSDLPLRPGYLPLLFQLIRAVAQADLAISGPVAAGSTVQIAVPPDAARMEIITPTGAVHRYDALAGKRSFAFSDTESAGPYRVLAAGSGGGLLDVPRGAFVVEPPREESDLSPLDDVERWNERERQGPSSAAVRQPLVSYVLLAFALFVLAEGALRLRAR